MLQNEEQNGCMQTLVGLVIVCVRRKVWSVKGRVPLSASEVLKGGYHCQLLKC